MVISFAINAGMTPVLAEGRTWTRSEILAVSDAEAIRLNYNVEQKSVSFHKDNAEWWEYLKQAEAQDSSYGKIRDAVKNRDFLAVRYDDLGTPTLGGELWVLIDRETGQVFNTIPFWKDQS